MRVVGLIALVLVAGCGEEWTPDAPAAGPLAQKLATLAAHGVPLHDRFTIQDVEKRLEGATDWPDILIALGTDDAYDEVGQLSPAVWYYDAECIEDDGDYVRVLTRMSGITRGALVLTKVTDNVDIESGKADVWFGVGDRRHHLGFKQQDDWISPVPVARMIELLAEVAPDWIYAYCDLGGQDGVMLGLRRTDFEALTEAGVPLEPLR